MDCLNALNINNNTKFTRNQLFIITKWHELFETAHMSNPFGQFISTLTDILRIYSNNDNFTNWQQMLPLDVVKCHANPKFGTKKRTEIKYRIRIIVMRIKIEIFVIIMNIMSGMKIHRIEMVFFYMQIS